ncbi:MAG: hypothetical protein LAT77_09250 [Aliidiomarina sp.]|uniref:hypothetical protein n=1 Tax=Aliidiomarina sp. TaxID=1872439 RepID=UPI0025C5BE33|nr:hypothetical protein [Aliidiomarina sp.]MCH8502082.1 hypothetical protein [Aliidiomarina sp.]
MMRVAQRVAGFYLWIMALIVAGMLAIALLIVERTEQLQRRTAANQVAEYAAESVAVIAARDLNFKAITNRAMLANEVVIGQLLGVYTWYDMARDSSEQIALYSAWIPYVNAVTRSLYQVLQRMRGTVQIGVRGLLVAQQGILELLQQAQWVFHQASWLSTLATAHHVVASNDERLQLHLLNHQTLLDIDGLWLRFQERTVATADHDDYVRMVQESQDPFSQRRTYRWFDLGLMHGRKAGGSDVKRLQQRIEWQSVDTLSIHQDLLLRGSESWLGGGSAFFSQRLPSRGRTAGFGESYRYNRRASQRAGRLGSMMGSGHPIPRFYRLKAEQTAPQITLVLRSKPDATDSAVWGAGRAEIYFSRPQDWWPRRDQRSEPANLHNALWQVRVKAIPFWQLELLRRQ